MTFRKLFHLLFTSRYTRSLEKRIEALEAAVATLTRPTSVQFTSPADMDHSVPCCDGQINPQSKRFIHVTDCKAVPPKPFQIKRSWRMEKLELERQHNQREEKGKRLAKNLQELPPKLYQ
jgi:hypothetical protein